MVFLAFFFFSKERGMVQPDIENNVLAPFSLLTASSALGFCCWFGVFISTSRSFSSSLSPRLAPPHSSLFSLPLPHFISSTGANAATDPHLSHNYHPCPRSQDHRQVAPGWPHPKAGSSGTPPAPITSLSRGSHHLRVPGASALTPTLTFVSNLVKLARLLLTPRK